MPMTNEQIAKITKYHVLHFPTVLGGLVPTYNIPGVSAILNFTPETLGGHLPGKDHEMERCGFEEGQSRGELPRRRHLRWCIASDGSGTTFVWTDYLSKISPEWKSKVGAGTSVSWPVGLGGKGNEGVAGTVKQTPNSIGYVELIYAVQNKMAYGAVKNAAGDFVKADFDSVSEAAAGAAKDMPSDFRVSITNAPGKKTYPISTLHLAADPRQIRRRHQEERHPAVSASGCSRTARNLRPDSTMRRCLSRCS